MDLLERVARANDLVGDGEASFPAWSRALELVDERTDPLRASRILLQWFQTARATGRLSGRSIAEATRAVDLSQAFPDSKEYAEALANLSQCLKWSALEQARRLAEQAVQAAHRSGSNEALCLAYTARGNAYSRDERSDRDTAEAARFARMSGDPELICWTLLYRQNYLVERGRVAEAVEIVAEGLNHALDAGALSTAVFLAGVMARELLMFGRLSESSNVIRTGLSLAGLPNASATVRLSAALLSVRQGNLERAGLHLERANELVAALENNPGREAPPVLAEYLLAIGEAEQVLAMLSRTLIAQFADPRIADEMLMWGARAAADLMESGRDRRDSERERKARAALDDLVMLRGSLLPPPFEVIAPEDLIQPAMKALFTAETARCVAEAPTSAAWEEAVYRCAAAGMRWEEAVASWRWAQALLAEGATRAVVAVPLRSAYRFAIEASAIPLQRQVETLARLDKILLQEPAVPSHDQAPAPFRSLTKREREVLSYLVAGRTYSEIASAMFISEKTVSVHVSNLLHKTGTSSRREVSALALRLAYSGDH